ncbi:MAG: site-specific DNA-methyltransferase [Chloroflexi bacterium]|nr:site-specific DNA-methyltransferase [Chloroflexota bacterium]
MSQIQLFPGEVTVENNQSTSSIKILPAADVLDTLNNTESVNTIILDPWYNKGVGGTRPDYHDWLSGVIAAASRKAQHIFVWGFPEILAFQIPNIPKSFSLVSWLTWYYKNCPSVIRGWRSAQNACLHLARESSSVYPENFLNDKQLERWKTGKMRFVPGPPSVLEVPLNIGFVGRSEQTGHPAQKPLAVIEPLIRMSTGENDTVLDPMCGSGTTGEACLRLNRRAILCDSSEEYLSVTKERVANYARTTNGR